MIIVIESIDDLEGHNTLFVALIFLSVKSSFNLINVPCTLTFALTKVTSKIKHHRMNNLHFHLSRDSEVELLQVPIATELI